LLQKILESGISQAGKITVQNRRKVPSSQLHTSYQSSPVALAYTEAFEISSLTFTLLKTDEKAILLATKHLQPSIILLN
jgi:hypothetical protein